MNARTITLLLAAALAAHVHGQDDYWERQALMVQVTCLESERSRCRVMVEPASRLFSDRVFALKVGETIVFDRMANEKRRCWNWACGAASRYEWPEEPGAGASVRTDGDYDQVLHAVSVGQQLFGVPERRGEHPGYSGWHAPVRVAAQAPALRERFTCVDSALGTYSGRPVGCSLNYHTEQTADYGAPLSMAEGQSVVHDHVARTLQVCVSDSCGPLPEVGLAPVIRTQTFHWDHFVAVKTVTHVRLLTRTNPYGDFPLPE